MPSDAKQAKGGSGWDDDEEEALEFLDISQIPGAALETRDISDADYSGPAECKDPGERRDEADPRRDAVLSEAGMVLATVFRDAHFFMDAAETILDQTMLFVPPEVDVLGKLRVMSMVECDPRGNILGPALEGDVAPESLFKFSSEEAKRFRSMAANQIRPAAWRSVWNAFVRFWINQLRGLKMATSENVGFYEQNAPHFNRIFRALKSHLKLHAAGRERSGAYGTANFHEAEEYAADKDDRNGPGTPKTPGGGSQMDESINSDLIFPFVEALFNNAVYTIKVEDDLRLEMLELLKRWAEIEGHAWAWQFVAIEISRMRVKDGEARSAKEMLERAEELIQPFRDALSEKTDAAANVSHDANWAHLQTEIGAALCGMSCQDAAMRKFEQALEVFERSDDRLSEANTLTHLGVAKFTGVQQREGVAQEELHEACHQALDYFDRAKDIYDKDIGQETGDMIKLLEAVADVHKAKGELMKATKIRERIVESSSAIQGPMHVATGDAMVRLAELLYSSDQFQAAAYQFQRGIDVFEATIKVRPTAALRERVATTQKLKKRADLKGRMGTSMIGKLDGASGGGGGRRTSNGLSPPSSPSNRRGSPP